MVGKPMTGHERNLEAEPVDTDSGVSQTADAQPTDSH